MNIYLLMANSRVKGSKEWNNPYVVYATETKEEAERDAIRYNQEKTEGEGNDFLEWNYFVEECRFFKRLKTEE